MVVQEGVGGVLERRYAAGKSNNGPHWGPSLGVAANAGSSSLPRQYDSPGRHVDEELLPQQICALLPRVSCMAQRFVRARMASSVPEGADMCGLLGIDRYLPKEHAGLNRQH
jgi:hypothetical protein